MLKAIVQQKDVDAMSRFEALAVCKAIGTNAEQNLVVEAALEEGDFIAGARRATIAAGKNGDAFSLRQEFLGEPKDHGCFAGSAGGQIADADDGGFQAFLSFFAVLVLGATALNIRSV